MTMKKFTFDKGLVILLLAVVGFYVGRKLYFKPSVIQGDQAPNFTAQMIDNQAFELAQLEGSYVLLDFWGSWCGPCRGQNKHLVPLMRKLTGKITPVSIGIERDSNRWQAAIRKDDLYWPNHIMDATSNLKFLDGPISDLYGVNQVPTDILLDPTGKVLAINPSFQSIIAAVQ